MDHIRTNMFIDLSHNTVCGYWEKAPKDLSQVVEAMSSQEDWVIDTRMEFETTFEMKVSEITAEKLCSIAKTEPDRFLRIIYHIGMKRLIMIINEMNVIDHNIFTDLLYYSLDKIDSDISQSEKAPYQIFRDRIVSLCQAQYAINVFDPTRLDTLAECMREVNKETGGIS